MQMHKNGLFDEDPLCACSIWLQNAPDEFLKMGTDVLDAMMEDDDRLDEGGELWAVLGDWVLFAMTMECIKKQNPQASLSVDATDKLVQEYAWSCVLETMRRKGLVEVEEGTLNLPLSMIRYKLTDEGDDYQRRTL